MLIVKELSDYVAVQKPLTVRGENGDVSNLVVRVEPNDRRSSKS